MIKHPVQDIDTRYIRQIQQQQIALALAKAERDAAIRDRDLAQARSAAMAKLVDALLASLRPYGFSRKRFLSEIRTTAGAIPDQGPQSLQHTVLSDGFVSALHKHKGSNDRRSKTKKRSEIHERRPTTNYRCLTDKQHLKTR